MNKQGTALSGANPLRLAMRRFKKSKLGVLGLWVLAALYALAIFAGFLSPYEITNQHDVYRYQPPQAFHLLHRGELRWPFVYQMKSVRDPVTFIKTFTEETSSPEAIRFFVRGEPYTFFGFKTNLHFFGVQNGFYFPLGTDQYGRCLLSRLLVGGQVSLSVGIIGILISFTIGIFVGGVSGFYGGLVDTVLQALVEVLLSFPRLPILLALAYVIPATWPSSFVYLGIVVVLAFIGWAGLARVVRGQVLSLRDQDYVQAARALGANDVRIIWRHLVPNLASYLIVAGTLALPAYILGESALSFLGLGVKEPMTSWGLLLKDANNFEALNLYPWLLVPGLMIFLAVLAFNFVGDALRDAVDVTAKM